MIIALAKLLWQCCHHYSPPSSFCQLVLSSAAIHCDPRAHFYFVKNTVASSDMKLFRYIQGRNVDKVKIEMTRPVSTKWTPMNEAMQTIEKEMCFYLNEEHQANPPQPTDPDVYLVLRPALTVYTRVEGGWMDDTDWKKEARIMDQLMVDNGLDVEQSYFYVNGYNSPWDPINRRNELWKVKRN